MKYKQANEVIKKASKDLVKRFRSGDLEFCLKYKAVNAVEQAMKKVVVELLTEEVENETVKRT